MLRVFEIKKATQGKCSNVFDRVKVKGVCTDSRKVKLGELFIAIKGDKFDGHDFIAQVIKQGANAVVVSKEVKIDKDFPVIKVTDTTKALGHIAAYYRRKFTIPIVAITGSAGKTTTKEMIAQVLSSKYKVLKNEKSENNHIGVPMTILKLRKNHQVLVLELGTNHFGEIKYLAEIAKPTIAVYTNIGESHLEHLKSPAGVFKEKLDLLKNMLPKGTVIFNNDNQYLRKISEFNYRIRKITYGIKAKADFTASDVKILNNGISFRVKGRDFFLNSYGQHNIYNALCAISCGYLLKVDYNNIYRNINKAKAFRRLEIIKLKKITVIDDAYNSNPLSLRSAIEALVAFPTKGKRIIVSADMLELGPKAKNIHAEIGKFIAESNIDVILAFGELSRGLHETVAKNNRNIVSLHSKNIDSLHQQLKKILSFRDVVLIKGSHGMHMERTVEFLKKNFN